MTTYSELKELESQLAELKKLPELERQAERENQNRENERKLQSFEHSLNDLSGQYRAIESSITGQKSELSEAAERLLNLLKQQTDIYKRADQLAAAVGATRVSLGRGQWNTSFVPGDDKREAARVMAEYGIRPPDTGLNNLLVTLITALQPPPPQPVDHRMPIVGHDGEVTWK